jgi:prevent-host-death family protein
VVPRFSSPTSLNGPRCALRFRHLSSSRCCWHPLCRRSLRDPEHPALLELFHFALVPLIHGAQVSDHARVDLGQHLEEGIDRAHPEGYYGFMKRATITETKNGLSRLLDEVRRGETILITERKVPIARIEPVRGSAGAKDDRFAALIGEGIVSPPERSLDVSALREESLPMLVKGDSAVKALLADREGSP